MGDDNRRMGIEKLEKGSGDGRKTKETTDFDELAADIHEIRDRREAKDSVRFVRAEVSRLVSFGLKGDTDPKIRVIIKKQPKKDVFDPTRQQKAEISVEAVFGGHRTEASRLVVWSEDASIKPGLDLKTGDVLESSENLLDGIPSDLLMNVSIELAEMLIEGFARPPENQLLNTIMGQE